MTVPSQSRIAKNRTYRSPKIVRSTRRDARKRIAGRKLLHVFCHPAFRGHFAWSISTKGPSFSVPTTIIHEPVWTIYSAHREGLFVRASTSSRFIHLAAIALALTTSACGGGGGIPRRTSRSQRVREADRPDPLLLRSAARHPRRALRNAHTNAFFKSGSHADALTRPTPTPGRTPTPARPPPQSARRARRCFPTPAGVSASFKCFDASDAAASLTPAQIQTEAPHYDSVWGTFSPSIWTGQHRGMILSRYYMPFEDNSLDYWQQPEFLPGRTTILIGFCTAAITTTIQRRTWRGRARVLPTTRRWTFTTRRSGRIKSKRS